jgi:hypothetical protein
MSHDHTTDGRSARAPLQTDPDAYEVPDGETAERCPHCSAPFADVETVRLHVGLEHPETLDDDSRERFRDTYRTESGLLRSFRLRALAMLVALYFGFLFAYALV